MRAAFALLAFPLIGCPQVNIAGTWYVTAQSVRGASFTADGKITQSGSALGGMINIANSACAIAASLKGSVAVSSVTILASSGTETDTFIGTATVDGSHITGTYSTPLGTCTNGDFGTWEGTRIPDGPPALIGILNAATFSQHIAPRSIVAIFGTNLASDTGLAVSLPIPTSLAGTQVAYCLPQNLNCVALGLLYVSPGQINAVLPTTGITLASTATAAFQVTVASTVQPGGSSSSQKTLINIDNQAPGFFQEGYDCPYPATCSVSATKTATNTVLRGAVTDLSGKLITSQNPILAGHPYVAYLTGLGFPTPGTRFGPVVYVTEAATTGQKYGVTYGPDFAGPSPCCAGLDQVNFTLPPDLRRSFTDGVHLPTCASITGDVAVEMLLTISSNVLGQASDSVQIPVLLHKGDLSCAP